MLVTCPAPRSCLSAFGSNTSGADDAACRCQCNVSDAEVQVMSIEVFSNVSKINTVLAALSGTYMQANHLTHRTTLCGGLFAYEWKHLATCDDQFVFNKWLFTETCSPGVQGNVGSLASPSDPLFNLMHPIFDKMAHVMRLAPQFSDPTSAAYIDESWESCDNTTDAGGRWDGSTYGSAFDDEMPFEDLPFVNAPRATGHNSRYTNRELWGLLNPANGHLPYIYDQFTSIGHCAWDPFGDDSAAHGGGDDDDGEDAAASDGGPPPGSKNASVGTPNSPKRNSSEPAGSNVSRPVLADDDRAGTPPSR